MLSCGLGNSYGHPHEETMEKLAAMEIALYRTDQQGNLIAETDGTAITWNVLPSGDYSSGDDWDGTVGAESKVSAKSSAGGVSQEAAETYILNTNTRRFHYSTCRSVGQMSEKNKKTVSLGRDAILADGYRPCGICKP